MFCLYTIIDSWSRKRCASIRNEFVVQLFVKVIVHELLQNTHSLAVELNLTDKDLGEKSGKGAKWFNDAKNRRENIQISSFMGVLSVLVTSPIFTKKSKSLGTGKYLGDKLITNRTIWFASLLGIIKDAGDFTDVNQLYDLINVSLEGVEIKELKGLVATLSAMRSSKRNLNSEELDVIASLIEVIRENELK